MSQAKYTVRKRRIRKEGVAIFVLACAIIFNLFTTLVINSINNSLTMKVQATEASIAALNNENETISITIKELVNKDRVFAVAESNGMTIDQKNVVAINN